jgi:hypothetical protein
MKKVPLYKEATANSEVRSHYFDSLSYYNNINFIIGFWKEEADKRITTCPCLYTCRESVCEAVRRTVNGEANVCLNKTRLVILAGKKGLKMERIVAVVRVLNKIERHCNMVLTKVKEGLPEGKESEKLTIALLDGSKKWQLSPITVSAYTGLIRSLCGIEESEFETIAKATSIEGIISNGESINGESITGSRPNPAFVRGYLKRIILLMKNSNVLFKGRTLKKNFEIGPIHGISTFFSKTQNREVEIRKKFDAILREYNKKKGK